MKPHSPSAERESAIVSVVSQDGIMGANFRGKCIAGVWRPPQFSPLSAFVNGSQRSGF